MNASFSYLLPDQRLNSTQIKGTIYKNISDDDIISYQNGKKKRKVYENCRYDQLQLKQIQQFKQYAGQKYDVSHVPAQTILRYLYSFDFNHPQALEKLKIYLEWYNDPKIQRLDQKTLQLINSGVCYTYGRDRFMRPIIFLNVALIDMKKYTIEDYLSATNAIITIVIQKLFIKGKVQNYLFIINTDNRNFTSLPLNVVKEMALKLSYVYSMRMGKMLIINCNYLVKLMYSALSPFLADVTKQKINLISTSEVQQGKLKQLIDINELQQKYGGFRENLIQKWPPQLPGKQLPSQIKRKYFNKKHQLHQLHELSFHSQSKQIRSKLIMLDEEQKSNGHKANINKKEQQQNMSKSEYYSCENDSQMFYRLDQKIIVNEGCCAAQQCAIY